MGMKPFGLLNLNMNAEKEVLDALNEVDANNPISLPYTHEIISHNEFNYDG